MWNMRIRLPCTPQEREPIDKTNSGLHFAWREKKNSNKPRDKSASEDDVGNKHERMKAITTWILLFFFCHNEVWR